MSDKQLQLGEDDRFISVQHAWEQALELLAERINKPSFESWVKSAKPVRVEDHKVVIGTSSSFAKHWLESKHLDYIKEILEAHLDDKLDVRVELTESEEPPILSDKLPKKPRQTRVDDEPISQPLNSRYTFDTFVEGPSCRLAFACAQSVAKKPGKQYNPLFIYGGPGLGKTHLMHAIGHATQEAYPNMRVVYVCGETFTYHYINALREHKTSDFRQRYRNVDMWLVDDVQFLVGKERTVEEFFHTYNAIYDLGKQIVLSSDRAPKELDLDPRLLSRFECGMLADIALPDFETRVAIVEKKAEIDHQPIPREVSEYIASLVTTSIRQLEGALIRLNAFASLNNTPVTTEFAREVLGSYFAENAPTVIDINTVIKAVAKRFDIDPADLKGKSRSKDIVVPRQVAMYLARKLTDASLPSVGRAIGGKDHTTVIHACKKVAQKAETDSRFAALLEDLTRQISDGKSC